MSVDDSILSRIHKLLALATSDNENEAALAAAKAQDLLFEHNISQEDLDGFSSEKNEKIIEVKSSGITRSNRVAWHYILAQTVARANLCTLLLDGSGNSLIWIGKKTNIEVAQYIFENLVRDLTRICDLAWDEVNYHQRRDLSKWQWVHGKTWKNSFFHGANSTISTRLNANLRQIRETQPKAGDLIVRNDIELKEFMNLNYPRLGHVGHSTNTDRSGYEAGRAAGSSVQFRNGIGSGGSTGPRLLGKG